MRIDLLLICTTLFPVMIEFGESFAEFNQSTRVGVLKDGRTFRIIIKDNDSEWLDKVQGMRIREYKTIGAVQLSPREAGWMQAMMNRG